MFWVILKLLIPIIFACFVRFYFVFKCMHVDERQYCRRCEELEEIATHFQWIEHEKITNINWRIISKQQLSIPYRISTIILHLYFVFETAFPSIKLIIELYNKKNCQYYNQWYVNQCVFILLQIYNFLTRCK